MGQVKPRGFSLEAVGMLYLLTQIPLVTDITRKTIRDIPGSRRGGLFTHINSLGRLHSKSRFPLETVGVMYLRTQIPWVIDIQKKSTRDIPGSRRNDLFTHNNPLGHLYKKGGTRVSPGSCRNALFTHTNSRGHLYSYLQSSKPGHRLNLIKKRYNLCV